MLHAGLDLSRRKLDVCLLSASGELVEQLAPAPDADALRTLARRIDEVYGEPVCAVTWSMTGARLVHDTLEQEGWDVEIADAQKVKGAGAAGLIAVGTAVANGPPRRSQRALLTHWAPALGSGVEARFGPGMLHADGR
jgi:hypothetical protein